MTSSVVMKIVSSVLVTYEHQNLVIVVPLFSTHTILRVTQSCVIASSTVAKSNDTRILKEIVAEQ